MAHKVSFSLTSIGFLFVIATYSFLGCYGTRTTEMGKCEDDGNPCTIDSCESGGTLHLNAPDDAGCTLGENAGKCNMGRCVLACETDPTTCKCTVDTQCPPKEDCAEWKCDSSVGQCKRSAINEGLPAGMQSGDDCLVDTCMAGAIVQTAAALGTTCATGACNDQGMCVDCFSGTDWETCGSSQCPVKLCNGEASTDSTNCRSGFAADSVCCDTACTEVCKSCNVMGMEGTCSNIPYYQPDPSYIPQAGGPPTSCDIAVAGGLCDGEGKCLKVSGFQCQNSTQCMSGMCSAATFKCLGAPGEACLTNAECVSGMCMAGACK